MVTNKLATWISLNAGATVFAIVVCGYVGFAFSQLWLLGLAIISLVMVALILGRGRYVTPPVVSGLPSVIVGGPGEIESAQDIADRTAPRVTHATPGNAELRDPSLRISDK